MQIQAVRQPIGRHAVGETFEVAETQGRVLVLLGSAREVTGTPGLTIESRTGSTETPSAPNKRRGKKGKFNRRDLQTVNLETK